MGFTDWKKFDALPAKLRGRPGVYEIRCGNRLLKVGIGRDLLKRLRQHRNSSQKRLKGFTNGPWTSPSQVTSKASILAKHLYFDRSISKKHDLRTQEGRRDFLLSRCEVRVWTTTGRDEARAIEKRLQDTRKYRYCRKIRCL